MKKKIFLMAMMITMIVCLFAIFVSAETITYEGQEIEVVNNLGDPSWYTGNYEYMTDKTSLVVLSNGDGTYTAYPSYYILKYSITISNGFISEAAISGFDYSHVNKTGKNYSAGAICKIELPEGLTKITNTYFGHNPKEPNVTEIVMSDTITTIGSHAFRDISNLKKIVLSKNLTKIGAYGFYNCKGLEEVVFTPGSLEYLDVSEANIFYGCSSLKEMDLSTRKIKALGTSFLSECTNIGKVTLPDCLEEIGYCSLYKCPNLYLASDFLPTSLKKVGFQFLSGCTNSNSVLYFPEGFTGGEDGFTSTYIMATERYKTPDTTLVFLGKIEGTINLEQFHASSGCKLTLIFTKNSFSDLNGTIVTGVKNESTLAFIGKTANTEDTDYYTQNGTLTINLGNASESNSKLGTDESGNTLYNINSKSYTLYFCGGEEVEVSYGVRSSVPNSQWGKHFTTPFEFDEPAHMDIGKHFDLTKVISIQNCGYDGVTENTCVLCKRVTEVRIPATGDHAYKGTGSCIDGVKCEICNKTIAGTSGHQTVETLTFANGITADGVHIVACQNEGCSVKTEETVNAVFTAKGYSTNDDKNAINGGYEVNLTSLALYERLIGELKYGIIIANANAFGEKTFLDENNKVNSDKALQVEMDKQYASFDCSINFGTNTDIDLDLVICAYVIEGDTVTYIQSSTGDDVTIGGESFKSVTLAQVVALVPAEIKEN